MRSCTPWDVLLAFDGRQYPLGTRARAQVVGATFSTLMPLRFKDSLWWVRARLVSHIAAPGLSLAVIRDQIDSDGVDFEIEQAAGTDGFLPLARYASAR